MNKIKKHIGLIILLAIALVFPTSLNYQARLNMRIIVTGLAVDKSGEDYQVTAQIVKTSPGNEKPGTNAEVDFITDKAKNLSEAVSKLAYKAGKVSAFSHTNFVVLGNSLFEEDVTECLDYFIRDKIIKNSSLVLFSGGSGEEEIKKTKNTELTVGIGLQKVFLFKENEGDGLMVTLIDFLNQNKMYSKSAVASELSFHTNQESKKGEDQSSSSSQGSSGSESSSQESGGSGSSSGGSGGKEEQQYFDPEASIVCFVDGKFVGKIEDEKSIEGFMLANKKTKMSEILVEDVACERLKGDNIEVSIKKKKVGFKVDFENGVPTLKIKVKINKCEINEIMTKDVIASLSDAEFDTVKKGLTKEVTSRIESCFNKTKEMGHDIFNAYEIAYKKHYKQTTNNFKDYEDFLKQLQLKVEIDIIQMDY